MFAIERQNKIKEILFKEKRVDVSELSKLFEVTEVTIRRDLDKLEQDGFLIKTYGGAVLNEEAFKDATKDESEDENLEDKQLIGSIASHMVENGEAIFLGPGTTCLEIAKKIKDKKITVLTNDLVIALELKDALGIKVIVSGGDLIQSTSMLVGRFAHQALEGIYINKAFIGVKGVNFETGYTLDRYEEALFLQEVSKISREVIIVADHTKFNKIAFARLGDLTMARKVITNKQIPDEYKSFFFEHAVKLYTTYEFE
ncbi:MAG: DeoR family transcriptional regulator, fructose operon transcriptional repressor [Thermoanaerobacteraceae bacterium]|uniref:DeoR family transcriptional regulator n=1 Tax=Biomaibacter acetigenes TaxID=2316383 RepID=A0A3G2R3T7_9FIRM|nr:DeoR/GlpR family DNA-binding transcription regulator [Biomaibacter acetigenes]AYO30133.1 DeoR family transcriptional regulator [Biomaibacter acetigenes]MDK2879587.1 DeoR family transcriptional regulator, fructose operon transcriptional repressor [Thermoanaerobacteraceae bacterium]MDN5312405.1 DeoR family transcriptional regulator, fructose operon transcriptional repressor [Thermoanaerobacteraceae bacterium]RKL61594.1 DeoR/GlpR transcriptional regulator [Thermoanaerobacteraceae bacterium SP2]